jgi:hypothetical protein
LLLLVLLECFDFDVRALDLLLESLLWVELCLWVLLWGSFGSPVPIAVVLGDMVVVVPVDAVVPQSSSPCSFSSPWLLSSSEQVEVVPVVDVDLVVEALVDVLVSQSSPCWFSSPWLLSSEQVEVACVVVLWANTIPPRTPEPIPPTAKNAAIIATATIAVMRTCRSVRLRGV